MKKIALAVAAVTLLATGAASAADLAARPYTKAAPMMAPVYNWTGFYIGANGGGGWSRKCWDIFSLGGAAVVVTPEGCHDATGGTVGGQAGYRWQSSAFVLGLEGQGNWANFSGSNTSLYLAGNGGNRTKVDAFGLFTGQIGYAINNFLLYVKGGGAVTSDKYEGYLLPGGAVFDRASETRWGGVVGIGGEFAFTPNVSFAIEYDHLFMGTRDVNMLSTGVIPVVGVTRGERIRQDVDMVTARINYRFGGPVVAKY